MRVSPRGTEAVPPLPRPAQKGLMRLQVCVVLTIPAAAMAYPAAAPGMEMPAGIMISTATGAAAGSPQGTAAAAVRGTRLPLTRQVAAAATIRTAMQAFENARSISSSGVGGRQLLEINVPPQSGCGCRRCQWARRGAVAPGGRS